MSVLTAALLTNNRAGKRNDTISFTGGTAGTLNGSTEFGFVLPASPKLGTDSPWQLTGCVLRVGTNTTHSDGAITLTIEKNSDGGTASLQPTAPTILNDAGTGAQSTVAAGTGITQANIDDEDEGNYFDGGDLVFVTLSETGSGGTDPSDVFFEIEFTRRHDFDPTA